MTWGEQSRPVTKSRMSRLITRGQDRRVLEWGGRVWKLQRGARKTFVPPQARGEWRRDINRSLRGWERKWGPGSLGFQFPVRRWGKEEWEGVSEHPELCGTESQLQRILRPRPGYPRSPHLIDSSKLGWCQQSVPTSQGS